MSRRILLADDSVTIQKVIELTFMDEDYEVTAVSNGDEAIALLDQLRPDFVIADVHMPGANGYAVCRRAKEVLPGVPVLLLVGTFEPFDEGQSRAAAADAFLKKPFDSQELLQLVEQLLGGRGSSTSTSAPAAAPEPFASSEPGAFDFDAPLGLTTATAAAGEALPTSDFGDPVAEPIWGNLDVDAAGDAPAPPAPTTPADPWSASAPAWEAAPSDEQVFELDADADIEDLTLGDDSLLPGEAEPFRFTGDGESLEPVGGLEALPSDEA
ncbi:MAG TPA: response regulator, partial [Thermoanaerobaculia bacterium]|nr:response regulator [Thermoanaerobaculia bacterium]